eukprot:2616472-Alexandrium_andersonii.AAC.1
MFAAGGCRPVTIDPDLWSATVARGPTAARFALPGSGAASRSGEVSGPTARSPDRDVRRVFAATPTVGL